MESAYEESDDEIRACMEAGGIGWPKEGAAIRSSADDEYRCADCERTTADAPIFAGFNLNAWLRGFNRSQVAHLEVFGGDEDE